jgi:hypothetical protein
MPDAMKHKKLCAVHSIGSRAVRDGASNSVGAKPNQQNGFGDLPSGSKGSSSNRSPAPAPSVERTSWIQPKAAL